jgi:hypothetical protein
VNTNMATQAFSSYLMYLGVASRCSHWLCAGTMRLPQLGWVLFGSVPQIIGRVALDRRQPPSNVGASWAGDSGRPAPLSMRNAVHVSSGVRGACWLWRSASPAGQRWASPVQRAYRAKVPLQSTPGLDAQALGRPKVQSPRTPTVGRPMERDQDRFAR